MILFINTVFKKAKSKTKFQQKISSLVLNDVKIYLTDGASTFDVGIVNLHPSKGTHWVLYTN